MAYQMPPNTPKQDERNRLYARYQKDARYHHAQSCKHCTDLADSFGRYLSTYCHAKHEHIAGSIGEPDKMNRCINCELYEKNFKKIRKTY